MDIVSTTDTKTTTTLVLDEKRVAWLKGIVQNPMVCSVCHQQILDDSAAESLEDKTMRADFWNALTLSVVK